jgi:hypothetical protein
LCDAALTQQPRMQISVNRGCAAVGTIQFCKQQLVGSETIQNARKVFSMARNNDKLFNTQGPALDGVIE